MLYGIFLREYNKNSSVAVAELLRIYITIKT